MQQTNNLAQNATCKVIYIFPFFNNILLLLLAIVIKKCYALRLRFGTDYSGSGHLPVIKENPYVARVH